MFWKFGKFEPYLTWGVSLHFLVKLALQIEHCLVNGIILCYVQNDKCQLLKRKILWPFEILLKIAQNSKKLNFIRENTALLKFKWL